MANKHSKRPPKRKNRRPPRARHQKPAPTRPDRAPDSESVSPAMARLLSQVGAPKKRPFRPDPFQVEAVKLASVDDVIVSAPTGSGKTWIAAESIERVLDSGGQCWYASPLKALSNSIYSEFLGRFGPDRVGILTGDRKENPEAPLIVGTTEILRNQLYDAMTSGGDFDCQLVVIDEAHYLGDTDRGTVWEEVMIYLPNRVHLLLLSATIDNADQIAAWLELIGHRPCQTVTYDHRPVPLHPVFLFPGGRLDLLEVKGRMNPSVRRFIAEREGRPRSREEIAYGRLLYRLESANMTPAIFFVKSRAECDQAVLRCGRPKKDDLDKQVRMEKLIDDFLARYPFLEGQSQVASMRRLRVAAHHAGHLPHLKLLIERAMKAGLLRAIFATSTVAAGVNYPARSVVLNQSDRFNGVEFVPLSAGDLQQMTGRAGRRGMDRIGFAVLVPGPFMDLELAQAMLNAPPEPIESQMKINFSMALNLLNSHRPAEVETLLKNSLAAFQAQEPGRAVKDARAERLMAALSQELAGSNCSTVEEAYIRSRRAGSLAEQEAALSAQTPGLVRRLRREAALRPGRIFLDSRDRPCCVLRLQHRPGRAGLVAACLGKAQGRRARPTVKWMPIYKPDILLDHVIEPPPTHPSTALGRTLAEVRQYPPPALTGPPPLTAQQRQLVKEHVARIKAVRAELAALPCRSCGRESECRDTKPRSLGWMISQTAEVFDRFESGGQALWMSFVRHLEFLKAEGLADSEATLTADGLWATRLRLDQPLMIAEAIRQNCLPDDDPPLMAALVAPFVEERDRDANPPGLLRAAPMEMMEALSRLEAALMPIRERKRAAGFETPDINRGPAAAVYLWAAGESWDTILELSEWDQGDMASLLFRTADNLRQVTNLKQTHPELAACAGQAVEMIFRPPVVVPT